jgi:hypothetical protein
LIRPRFIITKEKPNKQCIDLSKSFNRVTEKGGIWISPRVRPEGEQEILKSDGGGDEVADLDEQQHCVAGEEEEEDRVTGEEEEEDLVAGE